MEVLSDEEFQETEKIDPVTWAELDFINEGDVDYDDDVGFYCKTRKKLLLDEVPAAKRNVRKLRLKSDSERAYREEDKEEFAISNSEHVAFPEGTKIIISERMRLCAYTDNYEWNHYKLPKGDVYEFPKVNKDMKLFFDTLFMATKSNRCVGKENMTHEIWNSAKILSSLTYFMQ